MDGDLDHGPEVKKMQPKTFLSIPPSPVHMAKNRRSWLVLPLSALAGGLFAYFGIRLIMTDKVVADIRALDNLQEILLFLSFIPLVWFSIFFHEFGHVLGGIVAGSKPVLLLAGPLKLVFSGFFPGISWNKAFSTWGGLAICIPRDGKVTRRGSWILVAGGPVASLGTALIAYAFASNLEGAFSLGLGFYALVSLAISFGTLLPIRSGGFLSDGAQLLDLVCGSKNSYARFVLGIVLGQDGAGIRPKDWSVGDIQSAMNGVTDPVLRVAGYSILATHAEDNRDPVVLENAYEAFAQCLHEGGLDSYPVAFRAELVLPVAIFIAEYYRDPDLAEKWMKLGQRPLFAPYYLPCAYAMIASCRGNSAEAARLASDARAMLSSSSAPGSGIIYQEKMLKIEVNK